MTIDYTTLAIAKRYADSVAGVGGANVSYVDSGDGNTLNSAKAYTDSQVSTKVDKVTGKELSTNDFTDTLKTKLDGIEEGANIYNLPIASSTILGGIKIGNNLSIDENGVTSSTNTTYEKVSILFDGLMSKEDKIKLNGIEEGANIYELPTASASVLGGVRVGRNLLMEENVINVDIPKATTTVDGLMSKEDKIALNGKQDNLGFTPIQQSGGTNMSTTKVKLGASNVVGSETKLLAEIGNTPIGEVYTSNSVIPITNGGTGATTRLNALANLGFIFSTIMGTVGNGNRTLNITTPDTLSLDNWDLNVTPILNGTALSNNITTTLISSNVVRISYTQTGSTTLGCKFNLMWIKRT